MIPNDILGLIRRAYPTGDLHLGAESHLVARSLDSRSLVATIVSRIEDDCNVAAYYDAPGSYFGMRQEVFFTLSKRDVPLCKRSTLKTDEHDYTAARGGVVYDGDLKVSRLGPYAALAWHETRVSGSTLTRLYYRSPPTTECARLQRSIEAILSEHEVEVLPWQLLDVTVPGMIGRSYGQPGKTTLFDCLFNVGD